MRCDEQTEILGVDDAEMGEFAYDYVGIDLVGGGHEYHDDRHSHGQMEMTSGGREPHHTHAHATQVMVVPKDSGSDTDEKQQ